MDTTIKDAQVVTLQVIVLDIISNNSFLYRGIGILMRKREELSIPFKNEDIPK